VWASHKLVLNVYRVLVDTPVGRRSHQDWFMSLVQVVFVCQPSSTIINFTIINLNQGYRVRNSLAIADSSSRARRWHDLVSISLHREVKITCDGLIGCESVSICILIYCILFVVPSIAIALRFSLVTNLVVRKAVSANEFADGDNKYSFRRLLSSDIDPEWNLSNEVISPVCVILTPFLIVIGNAPRISYE